MTEINKEILNNHGFVWKNILDQVWDRRFDELKTLVAQHKRFPKGSKKEETSLYGWYQEQNNRYEKGNLKEKQLELLRSIGFKFWKPRTIVPKDWDTYFERLKIHLEKENDYSTITDVRLKTWVFTQRQFYKRGILTKEKESRLNTIGFVWNELDYKQDNKYKMYRQYFIQHGRPPSQSKNNALWKWAYKIKKNKSEVSEENHKRLKTIGFIWDDDQWYWDEMCKLYKSYIQEFKIFVLKDCKHKMLKAWVVKQRSFRALGKLNQEQIQKLDNLDFMWNTQDAAWNVTFEAFKTYIETQGKYPSKNTSTKLASFVSKCRGKKRTGKLSQDRIDKLNSIGFVW